MVKQSRGKGEREKRDRKVRKRVVGRNTKYKTEGGNYVIKQRRVSRKEVVVGRKTKHTT